MRQIYVLALAIILAGCSLKGSSPEYFSLSERNTNTFIGSMNIIIDSIRSKSPDVKIVVISNFTEDLNAEIEGVIGNGNGKPIIELQEAFAEYHNFPFLDLSKKLNLHLNDSVKTLTQLVPDGTHPASDVNFKVINVIADSCAHFLKPIFDNWENKRIAWYGTSIPAGYPYEDNPSAQYPKVVGKILGCSVDNYSVSSSLVRLTDVDKKSVSKDRPSFLDTSNDINYMNKLVKLFGTEKQPDLIILDYGRNDFVQDQTDFDISKWRK